MSNKYVKEILEWVGLILLAWVVAFCINEFIIVNAKVPTASMEPTVMTNDRIVGFRLSYMFEEPKRGDIVIFKFPDNEKILYIKRIIGMPGDTVLVDSGTVFINGEAYEEPYVKVDMRGSFGPYEVPEGHYFMMGDNRNDSADSRYWENTYLEREKIIGKAIFRYWPEIGGLTGK
ncbi:MAG: signal peptidase I [Lachnospiraceae bacterium]|nr:signal peptidase I [Lachnospiraceae bacterium]